MGHKKPEPETVNTVVNELVGCNVTGRLNVIMDNLTAAMRYYNDEGRGVDEGLLTAERELDALMEFFPTAKRARRQVEKVTAPTSFVIDLKSSWQFGIIYELIADYCTNGVKLDFSAFTRTAHKVTVICKTAKDCAHVQSAVGKIMQQFGDFADEQGMLADEETNKPSIFYLKTWRDAGSSYYAKLVGHAVNYGAGDNPTGAIMWLLREAEKAGVLPDSVFRGLLEHMHDEKK